MTPLAGSARMLAVAGALVTLGGCGGGGGDGDDARRLDRAAPPPATASSFGPAPATDDRPLTPALERAIGALTASVGAGDLDEDAVATISRSGDPRLAWVLADALRLVFAGGEAKILVEGFAALTGVDPTRRPDAVGSPWKGATDHLIAWDLPAPPKYRQLKAAMLLLVEPGWKPFFDDAEATIDWRLLGWGGVRIDGRALGDERPCPEGCIPALDDPPLTGAAAGGWYPDDRDVFGLVVGGAALALPKNIMEVHEMVNLTLGGRRLGIPYCTLCGSAQAYATDSTAGPVVLRTSGLLTRSNKVMYDLNSRSAFDTFTGVAVSGPLRRAGVSLEQVTVVVSTWGAWKAAHPRTRIVARDGGLGRDYPEDPLEGRDDDGPIFPIGNVDPRLPAQSRVVGVGQGADAVAFPVADARAALDADQKVRVGDLELVDDGGGLRARTDGRELPTHEAFWFAWSQFHPGTALWRRPLGSG